MFKIENYLTIFAIKIRLISKLKIINSYKKQILIGNFKLLIYIKNNRF